MSRLGIPSIDAPHVIQLFAEAKLIAAAKLHLDQMRQRGYGIQQAVYERILRDVGEL
jgi:predicted nucleic acid-binding protein